MKKMHLLMAAALEEAIESIHRIQSHARSENDAINRVPHIGPKGDYLKQMIRDKLIEHKHYINKHGQDMP